MPFSFPSSPTTGQTTSTQNGRKYRYAGNNVWELDVGTGEDTALRAFFVPPAPTGLTATAGNAQVSLSWTAPTVLAQTPITDYAVQFSSNGGSTWTTFSDGTSTATAAAVTGLTNGTAYVFRVAAVNGVGTGSYTAASGSVTPAPGPTDANFSSVALLLHMDGSGSTFVDSSGTPKTITAAGNATQTTDQSKFGGKSLYVDGSGDSIETAINGVSSLSFSTVEHTVEFWFRTSSTRQYACLFYRGRQVEAAYDYVININNVTATSGDIYLFSLGLGGSALGSSIDGLNDNQWHHLAICRDSGNVLRMYIDGVQRASMTFNMTETHSNSSDSIIRIGRDGALTSRDFAGYIDDLRISRVCRYPGGTTFTPPTAAFPDA